MYQEGHMHQLLEMLDLQEETTLHVYRTQYTLTYEEPLCKVHVIVPKYMY